jgi:hypothetical protein
LRNASGTIMAAETNLKFPWRADATICRESHATGFQRALQILDSALPQRFPSLKARYSVGRNFRRCREIANTPAQCGSSHPAVDWGNFRIQVTISVDCSE